MGYIWKTTNFHVKIYMTCLIGLIETNIFRMIKLRQSYRKAAKKLILVSFVILILIGLERVGNFTIYKFDSMTFFRKAHRLREK